MSELVNQLQTHAGGADQGLLDNEGNVVSSKPEIDFNKPYAAPGVPAHLPLGVVYQSYWKSHANGMGQHAREQIAALASVGVPLQIQDLGIPREMRTEELHEEVLKFYPLTQVTFQHVAIAIKHFVLHTPDQVENFICPIGIRQNISTMERVLASTVVYTSWERDTVHHQFVAALEGIGQLWVPCYRNAVAFIRAGVPGSKVHVVPYPFDSIKNTVERPTVLSKVRKGRRFYHIGKWEPRKNQHSLIGAFLLAFKPQDQASLLLKISEFGNGWAGYPSSEESVSFWLDDSEVRARGWTAEAFKKSVRIINDVLSEGDIRKLHEINNIYVSCGLGEAWDIPAFDAKLQGNRLVYTGFGGPEDYAEQEDIRIWGLREETMQPVHSGYGWEPNAQWAKYSTDELAESLKQASVSEVRRVPQHFYSRYSRGAVGKIMHDNLVVLAKKLGCSEKLFG